MKTVLCTLCLLMGLSAFAEDLTGPLKAQSIQVIEKETNPTSCRLYRKRFEMFLQRQNEMSLALSLKQNRLSARDLIDLIQRKDLPLDLIKEKIIWTLEFDIQQISEALKAAPMTVELDSPYLQWQTNEGLFPDHMFVQLDDDKQTARVTYKMTYMEACLSPIYLSVRISPIIGPALQMQSQLDPNLF